MPASSPNKARLIHFFTLLFCFVILAVQAEAVETFKPYILASQTKTSLAAATQGVKTALREQKFSVVGTYILDENTNILVVTNHAALTVAAQTPLGGYGAVQRVAITAVGDEVQVSYTNPLWMQHIYHMAEGLDAVAADLKAALGEVRHFGLKNGKTAAELKEYRYMKMLPYFEKQVELSNYKQHKAAVKTIRANLMRQKAGVKPIYVINIPNKKQTVFGVGINEGAGADKTLLKLLDTAPLKQSAYLPYEILVDNGKVIMLPFKFRLAQSFPDLSMSQFLKIGKAPHDIGEALREVAQR